MLGELQRMRRPAMPVEIGGRGDGVARHGAKPARDQRGIGQASDPQRRIKALADQVDHRVAEMQIDANSG